MNKGALLTLITITVISLLGVVFISSNQNLAIDDSGADTIWIGLNDTTTLIRNDYKVGVYYFGVFSPQFVPESLAKIQAIYNRTDWWGGIKDFYGRETNIPLDTRGWVGDFSHLKPLIGYYNQKDISTVETHIRQAKSYGINYFNFYWYYDGVTKQEKFNDGLNSFLSAANKNDLKFMISVTADNFNIPETAYQDSINTLVNKYLSQTNYLKLSDGRPIITILDSRKIGAGDAASTSKYIEQLVSKIKQTLGKDPYITINVDLSFRDLVAGVNAYTCLTSTFDVFDNSKAPLFMYMI